MRTSAIITIGILLTGIVSFTALGGDAKHITKAAPPFSVVFVSSIESKSEKARIRSTVSKRTLAAVQAELAANPFFAQKLKARGILVQKVIRLDHATNGNVVVYVR